MTTTYAASEPPAPSPSPAPFKYSPAPAPGPLKDVLNICPEAQDVLKNNASFSTFYKIIDAVGNEGIEFPGGYDEQIVVVPTNDAFKAAFDTLGLSEEEALDNYQVLNLILREHLMANIAPGVRCLYICVCIHMCVIFFLPLYSYSSIHSLYSKLYYIYVCVYVGKGDSDAQRTPSRHHQEQSRCR